MFKVRWPILWWTWSRSCAQSSWLPSGPCHTQCSLLLLPRVGVEEPFEEDQNEHSWQYFRWHKDILRNELTGPGFSPLSNLRCFSLCHLSFFSFLCVPTLLAKGQEVRSSQIIFPPFLWVWLIISVFLRFSPLSLHFGQCVSTKARVGKCHLVQLSLVLGAADL